MLTIGEFSAVCRVSAKTLRYYEEIGLVLPIQIDSGNGYRYNHANQLQTMMLIAQLKKYRFSLSEIKTLLYTASEAEEKLLSALHEKKKELVNEVKLLERTLCSLDEDMEKLRQGKRMIPAYDAFAVEFINIPEFHLLSIRETVKEDAFAKAYQTNFNRILHMIKEKNWSIAAPAMVLFHRQEYTDEGMDSEFAVPLAHTASATRIFAPGLCLKTVVKGSYENLSSAYVRLMKYAEEQGLSITDALFEVYVKDPSAVRKEADIITEVYLPVSKGEGDHRYE